MTETLKDAAAMLGIKKEKVSTTLDFMPFIRRGLPTKAVASIAKVLELSPVATVKSLGVAERTYARRIRKHQHLSVDQSERVVRLARVLAMATEVLGDRDKARRWVVGPNRALGMVAPLMLLDTDIGAGEVFDELGRIEHGVYA
jgi:putative toxin-antitoxin system antitoxin component (TIGR02293 family)